MIPYALADHLWQSTCFAASIGLLAFLLRGYQARIRYHVWFAATIKFLVPFAWLTELGRFWEAPPAVVTLSSPPLAQPFSTPLAVTLGPPDVVSAAASRPELIWSLAALWLSGMAFLLIRWGIAWREAANAASQAVDLPFATPIPVRMSRTQREPGLFGWLRPVILLPEGILDRLDARQLNAVIAHELAHWRRRDNWTAAIHMMTTALFWFHPLVWLIGARLVEERERACDEEVIRQGNSPHDYASGIVTVCRHYLESPLPCAAGVSGGASSLQQRIRTIFATRAPRDLARSSRAVLAVASVLAVALPVVSGMRMQNPEEIPADGPRFEVASIRLNEQTNPGFRLLQQGGGRVVSSGVSVAQYIAFAYNLEDFQVVGGPRWMTTDRYNLTGKMEGFRGEFATNAEFRQAFKPLLRDRFGLVFHDENREGSVYFLTIDKAHKMKVHTAGDEGARAAAGRGFLRGTRLSTADLSRDLARHLGRPVIDRTGLKDYYDITLEWNPDSDDPNSSSTRPMLLTALREQLGLRLESGRGPVRHVVVDQLKRPSEN